MVVGVDVVLLFVVVVVDVSVFVYLFVNIVVVVGVGVCYIHTYFVQVDTFNVHHAATFVANTCTCPGGTPRTASACTTNGANLCASCRTGFRATGNACTGAPRKRK